MRKTLFPVVRGADPVEHQFPFPMSCDPFHIGSAGRSVALFTLLAAVVVAVLGGMPARADAVDIVPFRTANQSPLVQIFGLPAASPALIMPAGKVEGGVVEDMASNFAQDENAREQIL